MPLLGYPQRNAAVPGPLLNRAFFGGSLFTFCASYGLTDDQKSHYGPQCSCLNQALMVAGQLHNPGDVHCGDGDPSGPYDNRAFFIPPYSGLVNLCRTHCHCALIVPAAATVPFPPGERRPAYSSDSEGSASPLLRVSSSSSGSSVDIMKRDLLNRAPWEKSVKLENQPYTA